VVFWATSNEPSLLFRGRFDSHVLCDKLMASQSADADEFTNTKN
jgi:hypothetical protein